MTTLQDLLAAARRVVPEVEPADAAAELEAARPLLLDVREQDEWDAGHLPSAVHVPRGVLEMRIAGVETDKARRVLVYCAGGNRSLLAGESLAKLGYTDVASVAGGFKRWAAEGRPVDQSSALSPDDRKRYARHLVIPEVGEEGQAKLLASRVLLVGAGGLGSPAA